MSDDPHGRSSHGLGRLDEAVRYLGQGPLHLAGQVGDGAEEEGNDGPPDPDGGVHDEPGKAQQQDGQENEGDGAEHVAEFTQKKVEGAVLQDAAGPGGEEKNAERDAEEKRDGAGDAHHLDGLDKGLPELVGPVHYVGDDGI